MQKIRQVSAFSLLLGVALGAQAQSGPTVFGVVDTGVVSTRIGAARTTSMDSGIILGSRVGFRGNEDLGGGTRALYTLEMGLNNDTGALGQGGLGFGRQAFVGLSNPRFGRLTMGRHYSVLHTTLSAYTEGGLIWGHALNYFRDGTVLRLDNSLRYESPDFAGLSFKLMKAFGEQAGSTGNVINPSVDYRRGTVKVGASFMQRHKTAANTERYTTVGGSYDFGPVSASLAYYTLRDDLPQATSLARNAYEISAAVPLGTNVLWLAYGQARGRARADTGASSLSLRYDYVLSKRTRLYTGYSIIRNDSGASFTVNSASNAGPAVPAGNRVAQAIAGVSHSF